METAQNIRGIKMREDGDFSRSGINTIGIVGLGLIGGSYAKAYKKYSDAGVLAFDIDKNAIDMALMEESIDGVLTDETLGECDLVILALYNQDVIDYVRLHAPFFKKGCLVVDTGGLKRRICNECLPIANENGFSFIGAHPMAGKKFSGYKYSTRKLFRDSSLIIVPQDTEDEELFNHLKDVFAPCHFGMITVCSAETHDAMIAFTSEMAHIVSNAYIKSPTARLHEGFSAGSYKDMTRVAWLNEDMWTEIFMENRDNLIYELDTIVKYLEEYKKALEDEDSETLHELLRQGKIAKEEVDGV